MRANAVEVLLVMSPSNDDVIARAVFVMMVSLATLLATATTNVNVADAPLGSTLIPQEMLPALPACGFVQLHPATSDNDLKTVLAGMSSASTTSAASFGPVLAILNV